MADKTPVEFAEECLRSFGEIVLITGPVNDFLAQPTEESLERALSRLNELPDAMRRHLDARAAQKAWYQSQKPT